MRFVVELVALHAWGKLGLDPVLEKAGLSRSQVATAKLLVTNRFVEPLSEWALMSVSNLHPLRQ